METKNITVQETHKAIAIELMEEISRGKDVNTLLTRDKIFELVTRIKEKGEGYYLVYQEFNETNSPTVKKFAENKELIFNKLVKEIAERVQFDIEFYKHGKATNNLRKRFAVIIKNEGFWSSTSKEKKNNSKEKTQLILRSSVRSERKTNQLDWSNPNKQHRIVLEFPDESKKLKKNFFYLYFETEKQLEQCKELLLAMKIMRRDNSTAIKTIKSMQNLIEGSHIFYAVLKLIDAKQKVKKRKVLLNSLKNYSNDSFKKLNGFMKGLCETWAKKFKITKLSNQQVKNFSSMPKSKNLIMNVKKYESDVNFNSLSYLKKYANIIIKNLPRKEKSLNLSREDSKTNLKTFEEEKLSGSLGDNKKSLYKKSKLEELASLNKFIGFKMKDTTFNGKMSHPNSSFDINKFLNSLWFTINKKDMQIQFSNMTCLSKDEIINISGIFTNLDAENNYKENFLTILGPKQDIKKFFKFKYKKSYLPLESQEKFVEPEYYSLTYNQSNSSTFRALYLQIFHSIFKFEKKDFQLLETQNLNNKNGKFRFENPLKDVYFFLSFSINKSYKMRTKLVKALSYENERYIIEFNLEHVLNLDSLEIFKPFEIKVSLNLIPAACFDVNMLSEVDRNFSADYLKSYEMGFCIIDSDKISKRVFEFEFSKEGLNLPDENKIIINITEENKLSLKKLPTKFFGKMLNVGSEIYAVEELTKEFFESKMQDPSIDKETKEKFYNLNFSEDGCIYLRPPKHTSEFSELGIENENEFVNELKKELKVSYNDISNIFYNKIFNFLPFCEKFDNSKKISETINSKTNWSNFYAEDALEVDKNLKTGEWVYKLKKIRKFFLANFKGITENRNLIYHNYYTNTFVNTKLQNLNNDVKNSFRILQENMFDIYDFSQIDKETIENSDNYHWKLGIQFVNKNQMNAFIFLLKDLRRRVNFQEKKESLIIDKPIDIGVLRSINKNIRTSVKSLRILIDKFELRKNFALNENKILQIKISKTSVVPGENKVIKTMLESLDEFDQYGYKNSLLTNNELIEDILMLKNMKSDYNVLPREYEIDSEKFNTSQKIIKFSDSLDMKNKLLEIEAKLSVDKMFKIELIFKGKKSNLTLNSILNFENILNSKPQADVLIHPLQIGNDQTVCGILHLKAWSLDQGINYKFEDIFDRYILQFPKIPKDIYNNNVSLGSYEPNVQRRLIVNQIGLQLKCDLNSVNLNDDNSRTKLYNILKKSCIKYADDLINGNWRKSDRWKDLKPDIKARHLRNIKKFYVNQKRNEFYQIFAKYEWEFYLNKETKGKEKQIDSEKVKSDYLYPCKSDLLDMKLNKELEFQELKCLYYYGLPPNKRSVAWEKILDIEKLVNITQEKLKKLNGSEFEVKQDKKMNTTDSLKNQIYLHFASLAKNHSQFNINFSLIDNDLNFLTPISDNINHNQIKFIAKAYFLWSELNITTDSFVKGLDSEKKNFVYFFGLLKIIQRLYSVFKSESQTFWIIIGLSQIIELFYQSNPLYTGELSYTKIYVLISKLIMQNHLKRIYNKFVELEFPIEFFIAKLIPTLYSDFLQTELFLRLLDIIIFEASLKTNNYDRYEYLRVICTVPLTLLKLNEKKLLECLTVKEMEKLFDDLIKKSFNNQRFLELVRENSESYYEMKNILEIFVEINSNTSWDWKRAKIQKNLSEFFKNVEKENKKYLSKTNINLGNNFIEFYEEEVRTKLNGIHKVLSSSTPGEEIKSSKNFGLNKNYVYFCVSNFWAFDDYISTVLFRPEYINVYFEFENKITGIKEFSYKSRAPDIQLKVDYKDNKRFVNVKNTEINRVGFSSIIPKYMNIFLYTENNTNIIGEFHIEIKTIDFMSPYKLRKENVDAINKTVIEVCLFKSSNEIIKDEDSDIFNFLFNRPNYLYDHRLDSEIIGEDKTRLKISDDVVKSLVKIDKENLNRLNSEIQITNKFFVEEFKNNCSNLSCFKKFNFSQDENKNSFYLKIEEFLSNIFQDNKEMIGMILNWIKTNDSSFEEILYALILADTSTITVYDKLKLLFDVGRMRNYLINNEDYINVSKLKEMIYSIYKRYMVYFTKSDVDRSIDYILNRENLNNRKFAFIYHSDHSTELENIIYNNANKLKTFLSIVKEKEEKFSNIKKNLSIAASFLRNQFNLNKIPNEMLQFFINKNKIKSNSLMNYNQMRIDLDVDNIRKTKNLILLKGYSDNILIQDTEEYNKNYASNGKNVVEKRENLVESLLMSEINSIELNNTNLTPISFYKFKDIFFNLPFISDLVRAGCGFNYNHYDHFIKSLENITVEIAYPDRQVLRNFIFAVDNVENESNRNSRIQNFRISSLIESSMCINDLLELIISKLKNRPDVLEEFSYYFRNPNQISYFVMNKKTGIEEKIKLFDPFYSNDYIRVISGKDPIKILFKMESTEDISRLSRRIIIKKSGYAKYKHIYPYFEWRECKIKDDNFLYAKFKSFNNNYYFKMNEKDIILEDELI